MVADTILHAVEVSSIHLSSQACDGPVEMGFRDCTDTLHVIIAACQCNDWKTWSRMPVFALGFTN